MSHERHGHLTGPPEVQLFRLCIFFSPTCSHWPNYKSSAVTVIAGIIQPVDYPNKGMVIDAKKVTMSWINQDMFPYRCLHQGETIPWQLIAIWIIGWIKIVCFKVSVVYEPCHVYANILIFACVFKKKMCSFDLKSRHKVPSRIVPISLNAATIPLRY